MSLTSFVFLSCALDKHSKIGHNDSTGRDFESNVLCCEFDILKSCPIGKSSQTSIAVSQDLS